MSASALKLNDFFTQKLRKLLTGKYQHDMAWEATNSRYAFRIASLICQRRPNGAVQFLVSHFHFNCHHRHPPGSMRL